MSLELKLSETEKENIQKKCDDLLSSSYITYHSTEKTEKLVAIIKLFGVGPSKEAYLDRIGKTNSENCNLNWLKDICESVKESKSEEPRKTFYNAIQEAYRIHYPIPNIPYSEASTSAYIFDMTGIKPEESILKNYIKEHLPEVEKVDLMVKEWELTLDKDTIDTVLLECINRKNLGYLKEFMEFTGKKPDSELVRQAYSTYLKEAGSYMRQSIEHSLSTSYIIDDNNKNFENHINAIKKLSEITSVAIPSEFIDNCLISYAKEDKLKGCDFIVKTLGIKPSEHTKKAIIEVMVN